MIQYEINCQSFFLKKFYLIFQLKCLSYYIYILIINVFVFTRNDVNSKIHIIVCIILEVVIKMMLLKSYLSHGNNTFVKSVNTFYLSFVDLVTKTSP